MDITKLGAEELRVITPSEEQLKKIKASRQEIYIVLDNVLDTYNIGSVFRLADAVGAKKIFLCAGSETPPNHKIKKASVGTWQWVEWEYFTETREAIKSLKLKVKNLKVVAVELDEKAIDYTKADYTLPIALVVGHESDGISKEVLDMCDKIVQLPQLGINKSLNVMVSLGIVLYEALEKNSS
ncbi:MAG: TrmH family RNA methyltransferase [Candidatus Levybacteria bacterium]|nr:TrmH family RNA methyltransferase [Candidatus Levybacteria bacterium]